MAGRLTGVAPIPVLYMPMSPETAIPRLAAPVAFLVLLGLTSCGSASRPVPIPSAVSPRATASSSVEVIVISAYDAMWSAGQEAERAAAAQRQAILAPYATGSELSDVLSGIAADQADGERSWGQPVPHPYGLRVTGDTATLQDCQDDRAYGVMNPTTGQRLTHGGPRVHLAVTLARGADGAWRVSELRQVNEPC